MAGRSDQRERLSEKRPSRFRRLRQRLSERSLLATTEPQLFLAVSIFVGVFAGLAVVCFRITIDSLRLTLLGSGLGPPALRAVLVPTLIGLLVAFLVKIWFPAARGSGVNQTKAAVYVYDGYIPFRTVIGKFITSALAIGGGFSLGPEDPSLQVGAGLASLTGRRLKLSRERLRLIAPLGAAAGLAAAFNAPISALLFVTEEVIGTWSAGVLSSIVLAAVSSTVVARWFLGNEPLFRATPFSLENPGELIAYAILGIIGGFASLVFVKAVGALRPRLRQLADVTQVSQPAIAGLIVGLIAIRFPQVMGAGYETIDQAMHGEYLWTTLAILAALKILATVVSFTSGTPGGMFAPTLFMGAMVGGAIGAFQHRFLPHFAAPVGAYVLVGMGTMFAGILRAPMTSVFMIVEVSGSYTIVLPILISNTIAYLISRRFQRDPLFDLLSRQDGFELPSMEEQREEKVLRIEDAVRPLAAPLLRAEDTVADAIAAATADGFVLVDLGKAWKGITRERLSEIAANGEAGLPIRVFLDDEPLPLLHPDQPLDTFFRYSRTVPVLPVVHRATFQLLGVVSLDDVMATYRTVRPETAAALQ